MTGQSAGTRPPRWRKPLLAAHLVTTTGLIGADLALLALGLHGVRGADPQTVYPAASQVASWVVGPLVVLALATGIAQAVGSGWGLTRYWWVAIKLAATVIFTGVVWFVLVPRLAGSADAAATGEAFGAGERLPLSLVPAFAVTILVALTVLAIYKPGGRLRRSPADLAG